MIAQQFRDLPEARTPTGSHLPTLGRALDLVAHGPVLELGMGDCSTAQLHAACEQQGRMLYSYEHDPVWAARFVHQYAAPWHLLEVIRDYDDVPIQAQRWARLWAVALVDHAPAPRRAVEVRRLKDVCMLLVCHDTESASYGYETILPHFRFRWDHQPVGLPHTAVVSDYIDVGHLWGVGARARASARPAYRRAPQRP